MARFQRKYSLNEEYFETIDTEGKAYLAGFLAADGHCTHAVLHFGLSRKDRSHLEVIRRLLESDAPIKDTICHSFGKNHLMSCVDFCSTKLARDVKALGLAGNKLYRCTPPCSLPLHLERHFYRGLFDGDGSFVIRREKSRGLTFWESSLVGCQRMVGAFATFIASHIGKTRPVKKDRRSNAYSVQLATRQTRIVADLLYTGCTVALDRKHTIALEILSAQPKWGTVADMSARVTGPELVALRQLKGSWAAVACGFGLTEQSLIKLRRRLGVL